MWPVIQAMPAKLENHVWLLYEWLSRSRQIEQQPLVEPDTEVYLRTKQIRGFTLLSYFKHLFSSPAVSGSLFDFSSERLLLVLEGWAESTFGFRCAIIHYFYYWDKVPKYLPAFISIRLPDLQPFGVKKSPDFQDPLSSHTFLPRLPSFWNPFFFPWTFLSVLLYFQVPWFLRFPNLNSLCAEVQWAISVLTGISGSFIFVQNIRGFRTFSFTHGVIKIYNQPVPFAASR